jgi:hypothetical protein
VTHVGDGVNKSVPASTDRTIHGAPHEDCGHARAIRTIQRPRDDSARPDIASPQLDSR